MSSIYMQRCFELALKGFGFVSPNPMVGCVIVYRDQIIGEGYHKKYGQAHAEVNAIAMVKDKAQLKESTLYVNLEPCSHHGKTPPCADLIIQMQIPKVVIACGDPHIKVNGQGIAKLRAAGIEVVEHFMEEEACQINKRFFSYVEKKRPYIILKWAQSQDGFMDIDRQAQPLQKGSYRITDEYLRILDHLWRSQEDAILVGSQTLLNDNPQLNARVIGRRNPIRIGIDRRARLSENLHFFDKKQKSILFTKEETFSQYEQDENFCCIAVKTQSEIKDIVSILHQQKIGSLIVEGGKHILESFIAADLWDEARVFVGNTILGEGLQAPILSSHLLLESGSFFSPADIYPKMFNKQSVLYFKNGDQRYL